MRKCIQKDPSSRPTATQLVEELDKSEKLICASDISDTTLTHSQIANLQNAQATNQPVLYNQSWAIIIGISQYHKFDSIEYAKNSAQALHATLHELGYQTTLLVDESATKSVCF